MPKASWNIPWRKTKFSSRYQSLDKEKTTKANRGIGVTKKLRHTLPRLSLITIYKSFVRPNSDYYDTIYDQPNNNGSFCNKIERVQYNAALAIAGVVRDRQQITFVTLNRFYPLSNHPPPPIPPVFLMEKTKLDGIPCKIK